MSVEERLTRLEALVDQVVGQAEVVRQFLQQIKVPDPSGAYAITPDSPAILHASGPREKVVASSNVGVDLAVNAERRGPFWFQQDAAAASYLIRVTTSGVVIRTVGAAAGQIDWATANYALPFSVGGELSFSSSTGTLDFGAFPACRVYNSAQLIAATDTATVMTYDSEDIDTHGFHSTSSNTGRLTIPTGLGGLYLVGQGHEWDAQSGGGRRQTVIRHQGSTIIAVAEAPPNGTATFPGNPAITIYRAAAGEYFDGYMFHDRGSNLGIVGGTRYTPMFWCVRLGD